jgi:hypothetical protein
MRATAGAARDGEPLDAKRIGDRGNISDTGHDQSPWVSVRRAVARPVIGDDSRPGPRVLTLVVVTREPRARTPVQPKDRKTARITPLSDHQRPLIGREHRSPVTWRHAQFTDLRSPPCDIWSRMSFAHIEFFPTSYRIGSRNLRPNCSIVASRAGTRRNRERRCAPAQGARVGARGERSRPRGEPSASSPDHRRPMAAPGAEDSNGALLRRHGLDHAR